MKICNQWSFIRTGEWGIALLCFYRTTDFWGFVFLGLNFEFPRTQQAREIHREFEVK